jgi:hypothetical protein
MKNKILVKPCFECYFLFPKNLILTNSLLDYLQHAAKILKLDPDVLKCKFCRRPI